MFKAKCVICKDKDGNSYKFRASKNSFLEILTCIVMITFFVNLIVSSYLIFDIAFISCYQKDLQLIIVTISLLLTFLAIILLCETRYNYSLTVRLSSLIFDCTDNKNKPIIFDLYNTSVRYNGYSTIISDNNTSQFIPYLSKDIDDDLVKFLTEIGVTDLSQKKKEPS